MTPFYEEPKTRWHYYRPTETSRRSLVFC